jgi:hypothetical protein
MVVLLTVVAAVVAAGGIVGLLRRRRRPQPHDEPVHTRPTVRLLTTEQDLQAAVERAVSTERAEVARAQARIDRYGGLGKGAASSPIATGA